MWKYAVKDDSVLGRTTLGNFPATMDISPDGSLLFAQDDLFQVQADGDGYVLDALVNDVNYNPVGGHFQIVALGTRWGATQYNVRSNDRDTAPIGYAFTLAGDTPAERLAPAFLRAYGWEPRE